MKAVLARTLEAPLFVAMATRVLRAAPLAGRCSAPLAGRSGVGPRARRRLRAQLGLDLPLHVQYGRFLHGLVTLDLGPSLRHPNVPSMTLVREALPATTALAATSVGLAAVLGTLAAVLASGPFLGSRRVWVERRAVAIASMPLLTFAPARDLRARSAPTHRSASRRPRRGCVRPALRVEPALRSRSPRRSHAWGARRSATWSVRSSSWRRAPGVRAKDATWLLHALPPSLGPILAVIASQLGALLGGAVVLERLFERPGLGTLILEAYAARDMPVLEGAIIAAGVLFVIVQAAAAAVHAAIDPRVRA